jgi:hypothetical protein
VIATWKPCAVFARVTIWFHFIFRFITNLRSLKERAPYRARKGRISSNEIKLRHGFHLCNFGTTRDRHERADRKNILPAVPRVKLAMQIPYELMMSMVHS